MAPLLFPGDCSSGKYHPYLSHTEKHDGMPNWQLYFFIGMHLFHYSCQLMVQEQNYNTSLVLHNFSSISHSSSYTPSGLLILFGYFRIFSSINCGTFNQPSGQLLELGRCSSWWTFASLSTELSGWSSWSLHFSACTLWWMKPNVLRSVSWPGFWNSMAWMDIMATAWATVSLSCFFSTLQLHVLGLGWSEVQFTLFQPLSFQ